MLADIDPQLEAGVWVHPRQPLATVFDPARWVVEAFIDEADIGRVRAGQSARVHTGAHGMATLHGKVVEVDTNRTAVLPHAMLNAHAGGPVATLTPAAGERRGEALAPRDSLYRVKIALDAAPSTVQMGLGRVVIGADAQAWLPTFAKRAAAVLVRESGF